MSVELTERQYISYTDIERARLHLECKRIDIDVRLTEFDSPIQDNQINAAREIMERLADRRIITTMVLAKTQSGKTGIMVKLIDLYVATNVISVNNIYVITGLSSVEWQKQTAERMPSAIAANVHHRGTLPKFIKQVQTQSNVLIIIDEVSVAAGDRQSLYGAFRDAGFLDKQSLYARDIKIIEITATPDGTVYNLMNWGTSSCKLLAPPGKGYIGAIELYRMNRIKQCMNLCGSLRMDITDEISRNLHELKATIATFPTPRYHIIRARNGIGYSQTIGNFRTVFNSSEFEYDEYTQRKTSDSEVMTHINTILKLPPPKHTLIFIKEKLRCAITLTKQYLGVLYERYCSNPDDSVQIQGMLGRNTGYDVNSDSICYTNVASVGKYERLWNSAFAPSVQWRSKTTETMNGKSVGTKTFNDKCHYDNFSESSMDSDDDEFDEPMEKKLEVEVYRTFEECQQSFKARAIKLCWKGARGPTKKPAINGASGLYTVSTRNRPFTYADAQRDCRHIQGRNYRVVPCYNDNKELNSLLWWIIYSIDEMTPKSENNSRFETAYKKSIAMQPAASKA